MGTQFIEPLEKREFLSATVGHAHGAKAKAASVASNSVPPQSLSIADVQTILGQAGSQAITQADKQVVAIVDREGTILGIFARQGLVNELGTAEADRIILDAVARARTAAFFESDGEAFTTRTARFIIQDHFPQPINNTPGGPLYGVEFSSLINTDILLKTQVPAISGDPGGIPLYKSGQAVGGIGVAGDFHDSAPRSDFVATGGTTPAYNSDPTGAFFHGKEEHDFDEAVALAGAQGFMAPEAIRANHILVNGLTFPFTADSPARGAQTQSLAQLESAGIGNLVGNNDLLNRPSTAIIAGQPERDTPGLTFAGVPGLLRDQTNLNPDGTPKTDPQSSDPIRPGTDASTVGAANALTVADVNQVITNAVAQAKITRAGIRKPNGVNAEVHVIVVDTNGNVLGAFRMHDGTNFSYDVAVQKARTANFFSDNTHAFTPRAIGFMAQKFFPVGIDTGLTGPLFHVQNALTVSDSANEVLPILQPALKNTKIPNGITIFPGGAPLYKNGVLVGAVGVSGDGVDQDDIITFAGTKGFRPAAPIRSDQLSKSDIVNFILNRVAAIQAVVPLSFDAVATARQSLAKGIRQLRLPFVKFPRNPRI